MEKLCMVIHIDSFRIRNRRKVREITFAGMDGSQPESVLFDLTEFLPLSAEDQDLADACRRNLHGLDFLPKKEENAVPLDCLHDITRRMYDKYRSEDKYLVGYCAEKGEAALLMRLMIPSMDLADIECPLFISKLRKAAYRKLTCGFHFQGMSCGKVFAAVRRDWVRNMLFREEEKARKAALVPREPAAKKPKKGGNKKRGKKRGKK